MKDILPGILLAVFMGVCVYFVGYIKLPTILVLIVQIIVGAIIYIGLSVVLKLEAFEYLCGMLKNMLNKKKRK